MNGNPYAGERMDRTLTAVLAVLVMAMVIFLAVFSLTVYMGIRYRDTLAGTYDYRVSIANDAALGNVTLYLPIPGRLKGNSAVLEEIGGGGLAGLPAGWKTALIGTEKVTLLEVTAPEVPATPAGRPYQLSITTRVRDPVGTGSDNFNDLVLAPLAGKTPAACTGIPAGQVSGNVRCAAYRGSAYADYTGPRDARLQISLSVTGKNAWDVIVPSGNEYRDGFQVSFSGDERGWKEGDGLLATGIGDYGMGFWIDWLGTYSPKEVPVRQVRVTPAAGGRPA
jgi:hypothetical protein